MHGSEFYNREKAFIPFGRVCRMNEYQMDILWEKDEFKKNQAKRLLKNMYVSDQEASNCGTKWVAWIITFWFIWQFIWVQGKH